MGKAEAADRTRRHCLKRVLDRLILYIIIEKTEEGYYTAGDTLMLALGWRAELEFSTCPLCGKGKAYIAKPLPPFPVEIAYRPCNHIATFSTLTSTQPW